MAIMLDQRKIQYFFKRIIFRAVKLPAIYFIIGFSLIIVSSLDKFFPLTNWKYIFELTDKTGKIFIALTLATFIYKFAVLLCRDYEKKFPDHRDITALILSSLRKGLRIIFVLVVINIIITISAPPKIYLTAANSVINAIILGSIGWIAIQILYTIESVIYQQMMRRTNAYQLRAKALYTKTHIIRNIATFVIVILTTATILMSFNSFRSIGISLLASAGFLTAVIGLAGQKTLFSLFSGLQIALAQPIKIGDIVVIENNSGVVEEITFTYVTLKLADRRRLMIPINYFVEKAFENWSHEGESLLSNLHFYVDYSLSIGPLRETLNAILQHSSYWDKKIQKLEVANLSERTVEIRVQVSAANADKLSALRAEVNEKMLEVIQKHFPKDSPKI